MKDRLSEITAGAGLFERLPDAAQDVLVDAFGLSGARAAPFDQWPEAARVALVKAAGAVPSACGDAIPVAPARGAVQTFEVDALYPKGDGEYEVKPAGWQGRAALIRSDAFDRMRAQALRRAKSGDKNKLVALTPAQIGMARTYRALVEDHAAGAVRCSSVEALRSLGGGSREGFTDHRLALSRRIDMLHRRIGNGTAMEIRRVRPSKRGGTARTRVAILDRDLVDAVALRDMTIADVLLSHGWAVQGETTKALTMALGSILDRMIGPPRRQDILFTRCDLPPMAVVQKGA